GSYLGMANSHDWVGPEGYRHGDAPFQGEMDEVRVWSVARTEEQIREAMSRKLSGQEPGLVGLWNFDDPANPGHDASPGGHHGKLMGNARTVGVSDMTAPPRQPIEFVLSLEGVTSYVELPPNVFNELTEATIEAWVKWRSFPPSGASRFFSYGEYEHDTGIQARDDGTLTFFLRDWQQGMQRVEAPQLARPNEWNHIAV